MSGRFDPEQLRLRLIERTLSRVVENRWRGDLVEEFVKISLEGYGWVHCSANWNSWDFERAADGLRLQVKQAARLQTWGVSRDIRFGVAPAKGYYENGTIWRRLPFPQRLAELYVFAHHPSDDSSANHWDVWQWGFHVCREADLPPGSRSVSLEFIQCKCPRIQIDELEARIAQVSAHMIPNARIRGARPTERDAVDDADPFGSPE
jgi:hypothetical protein